MYMGEYKWNPWDRDYFCHFHYIYLQLDNKWFSENVHVAAEQSHAGMESEDYT